MHKKFTDFLKEKRVALNLNIQKELNRMENEHLLDDFFSKNKIPHLNFMYRLYKRSKKVK